MILWNRRRRHADFMPVMFPEGENVGYWLLLDAFGFIDGDGLATADIPLRYYDSDYNILREIEADALEGFLIAGEYGITFKEDVDGKSWFLVHTHTFTDDPAVADPYDYHLVRLSLDGQSLEEDHTFQLDSGAVPAGNSLTIPVPFVSDPGYNAAFAIAENRRIWLPTVDGAQEVNEDTGAFIGSAIAWPETIFPFRYADHGSMGGIIHTNWQLRGFQGGRSGLLAQFWYSDVTSRVGTFPEDPGPWITCNDVRWRWYHLPWGDTSWDLWHEVVITDTSEHIIEYWIPGGPFGGTPPGAPLSPWDSYFDIGGCSPTADVFCGVLLRNLTVANIFERDYAITEDGMTLRPQDEDFRRRRPVRIPDNRAWVVAAASQFGTQIHQRLDTMASTGGAAGELSVATGPVVTAPMSQWREPSQGPAT